MSISSGSSSTNGSSIPKKRGRKEPSESSDSSSDENSSPESEHSAAEEISAVKSHAARRKERKMTESVPTATTQTTGNLIAEPSLATLSGTRQHSVWVGNLAYQTTPDAIKRFFDGVGTITRVHMPTKKIVGSGKGMRGDNMGFAYMDFTTSDAKAIAITLSETILDGRKLLIKDGSDFTGRPSAPLAAKTNVEGQGSDSTGTPKGATTGYSKSAQKILKAQKQPPAPTLFMGNLPFQATAEQIQNMIAAHRSYRSRRSEKPEDAKPEDDTSPKTKPEATQDWLRKIRLGTFEDSGKCKGWAFLDFVNVGEATAVLINPRNHRLDGRDLVLEYASPDAVRRGESKSKRREDGKPFKRRKFEQTAKDANVEELGDMPKEDGLISSRLDHNTNFQIKPKENSAVKTRTRPRPGAALAMAKRENVAIVKSEGNKIKFD